MVTSIHEWFRRQTARGIGLPPLEVSAGRIFGPEEASTQLGIDIESGWRVRVDEYEPAETGFGLTYITPEGWEIRPDESRLSPEGWTFSDIQFTDTGDVLDYLATSPTGETFTMAELEAPAPEEPTYPARDAEGIVIDWVPPPPRAEITEADLFAELTSDLQLVYKEYLRTGGVLDISLWQKAGAPIRPLTDDLRTRPVEFIRDLYTTSSVENAEAILRALGLSEDAISSIREGYQVAGLEEERRTQIIQNLFPDFTVEDFANLLEENPALFWETIHYGTMPEEDKASLLELMGYEQKDIDRITKRTTLKTGYTKYLEAYYGEDTVLEVAVGVDKIYAEVRESDIISYLTDNPDVYERTRQWMEEHPPLSLGEELAIMGRSLLHFPKQFAATVLMAVQGFGGASVVNQDRGDRFISEAQEDYQTFLQDIQDTYGDRPSILGISSTDLASLPQNLAYSLTAMGAGLIVGVPLALVPVPGARYAAYAAGTAASGTVAYNMTTYQITQLYLEIKNEELIAQRGRGLTLQEEEELKADFADKARRYGLWEAIPEALSNLLFVGLLTAPLTKIVGRSVTVRILSRLGGIYGEELLTETITQKGQSAVEIEAGLREGAITWVEAFKEVAPQTFILTTVLAGLGGGAVQIKNRIKNSLKSEIGEAHPLYQQLIQKIDEMKASAAEILEQIVTEEAGAIRLPREGAKQPWQMTFEESIQGLTGVQRRNAIIMKITDPRSHYFQVKKAVSEGKPVPAEVLAEYPDLKAPTIPRPEPGEPEPGVQRGMFGEEIIVRPPGKGEIVQISMDDQLKLDQAREAAEQAPDDVRQAYEAQAEIEGLRITHQADPVANYRFRMGNRNVGLDSLISIREQAFPEYFTVKQAQALNPDKSYERYTQKGTREYNRVPRDAVLEKLTKEFNMTPDQIAERVMQIRQEKRQIREAEETIKKQMTEKPLEPVTELTVREVTENWETVGKPTLTLKQAQVLAGVFGEYVMSQNAVDAWQLTRQLRRETMAQRAESLKARAQELIVKEGVEAEEGMKRAIQETLSGELPMEKQDYFDGISDELRGAFFSIIFHNRGMQAYPLEMASTVTALTNALQGKPIPRERGTGSALFPEGGSAWDRLAYVFGPQTKAFKAIAKMAEEGKTTRQIIEAVYEITGKEPIPIDQETANYLRSLRDIPQGYRTLLEPDFNYPQVTDLRSPQDLLFAKRELELGNQFAKGEINLEEYQLARMEARDEVYGRPPPPTFEPPIDNAFKEMPLMNFGEKQTLVRLLKELGMTAVDIGSFIRANMASVDMSFWRQQKTLIAGHPIAFYRANVEAFKALFSQKSSEASWQAILNDPLYHIYDQINIDFLRPLELKPGTERWKGVEEFGYLTGERPIPRVTAKIPWIKWSARAFVTGTNTHNWLIFKTLYQATQRRAEKIGSGQITLREGEAFDMVEEMSDYAKMLTDFTQRAQLGRLSGLAPTLGALFFAPRSKLGRLLTPRHLVSSNPRVRAEAWKDLTLFVTAFGGLVMLGHWLDLWDVDTDPRSGEFMSIRIGNMRIDPWAGYRQFVVLYARLLSKTGISSVTGAEYEVNPIGALTSFFRSSVAPLPGIILDFWTGRNFLGEKVDIANSRQWLERIAPFSVQDIWEAFEESWVHGAISVVPAIFGEGVQTYSGDWEESWTKLGIPKYIENTPYDMMDPRYSTQDFYADHSSQFTGVDPETLTERKGYPEYIRKLAEVKVIKEHLDTLPNERLVSINADSEQGLTFKDYYQQWKQRQKLVDAGDDALYSRRELQPDGTYKDVTYKGEDAVRIFDADERTRNANRGNFSQSQYALLMEYWAIEDEEKRKQFLEKHEDDIGINPRYEYLVAHPKENALLGIFGQAKILTKEAYDEFTGLAKELDIPHAGLPERVMPPEGSVDNYFARVEAVEKYGANSAEAMLILATDEELTEFLGLDPPKYPARYYELNAKNRNEKEYWESLTDKDSPDYIEDIDERREHFFKKFPDSEYFDNLRRVQAIANDFDDDLIEAWVERGSLVDKYSAGSPRVKEWAFDNPRAYRKALEQNILKDKGALETDQERGHYDDWVEPAIRLQAKNLPEDKYWSELSDKSSDKYVEDEDDRREAFFKRFPESEYFDDMERIEAYKVGFSEREAELWSQRTEVIVKYEAQSAEAKLWLVDHPDLWEKALQAELLTDDGSDWNVPAMRLIVEYRSDEAAYDQIRERYDDRSDAEINRLPPLGGMNQATWRLKTVGQKRDWLTRRDQAIYLKDNTEYAQARQKINGYQLGLGEDNIDKWVKYYKLSEYGYWRERFLIENPDFFKRVTDLQKAKGQDPWDMPEDIPAIQYDQIYDTHKRQFDEWESYGDPESSAFIEDDEERREARDALILDSEGKYNQFGLARVTRDAYYYRVPQNQVMNYVEFYRVKGEGKPKDYPEGLPYWEDDWFMLENPEFHTEIWVNLLGNQPYSVRLVTTEDGVEYLVDNRGNPSKTPPTRELGRKYIEYNKIKHNQAARDQYRLDNSELDEWGVAVGIWSKTMDEQRKRKGTTASEEFRDELEKRLEEFEEELE